MAYLSIGKAWDETVATVAREGKLMFPVAMVFIALPAIIISQFQPDLDFAQIRSIEQLVIAIRPHLLTLVLTAFVSALIGLIGSLSITALALREGLSVGESIRLAAARFLPALIVVLGIELLAGLVFSLVLSIRQPELFALIALMAVIVFLIIQVRLALLNPVLVQEGGGPLSAAQRSASLTHGHFWRLFGFMIIFGVVMLIVNLAVTSLFGLFDGLMGAAPGAGLLSLIAGSLVVAMASVFSVVMFARCYRMLAAG